jgi:hypothetical protein
MAATILAGLKADGDISSATLSADGKVAEAKHCAITDVSAQDGKLSFTRLDEASPWPIQPNAKAAFTLLPDGLKLSQYMLRITGLSEGEYQVSINGKPAATLSAKELSTGWNVTTAYDSAIGERAKNILALVSKLQGPLNNTWRAASKAKDADTLAAAQKSIAECEAEIQAAVQPVAIRFEIAK